MVTEVTLDGTPYKKIGGKWFNGETYITPPQVVIRKLERRTRAARKPDPVAKTKRRSASDRSSRWGFKFDGLEEGDFKDGISDTSWRRKESLAGRLAREMNELDSADFTSYAVYRTPEVYIYSPARFDRDRKERSAKFDFRLDEEQAQYGFYVQKRDGPMNDSWDWLRFLKALAADSEAREAVKSAMEEHGLNWLIELGGSGATESEIRVEPADPLQWQNGEEEETVDWDTFAKRLGELASDARADVRLCRTIPRDRALSIGEQIAADAHEAFAALLPLYEASTKPR